MNKFSIQCNKRIQRYAIALGFFTYMGLILFMKAFDFQILESGKGFQVSYLWNLPKVGVLVCLLVVVIISWIFGERNSDGSYEYNKKYRFLQPLLCGLLLLMLFQFGFILGIFCTVVTNFI